MPEKNFLNFFTFSGTFLIFLSGYIWRAITNKEVRIVSRVSETEKKKIESLADKCGLSISEYIRKRALGYEPKTTTTGIFSVYN